MFEFDFGKLAIIAVVALIVLGPERLPRVARTAGALLRRARNSWQNVREEIERELAAEDLKKSMQDLKRDVDVRGEVNAAASHVEAAARDAVSSARTDSERP